MMRRHVFLTTVGELTAIAILLAAPFAVHADVGSFVEEFGSTTNREERTSFATWDTVKRQVLLPQSATGYASSAAAQSRTVAQAYGQVFKKATLSVEGDFPTHTRVDYFLTATGSYWEAVQPGQVYTFKNPGNDLRYRMILFSSSSTQTPVVRKLKIDYVRESAATETARTNDRTRVSDLREVTYALAKFKTERGSYPMVDTMLPKDRWKQMTQLLTDGRFLTRTLVDPKYVTDTEYFYDYLSAGNGAAYVVRARLEGATDTALTNDKDGVFAEISGSYTCNDPWYCDGQGLSTATEATPLVARPFSPLTDAKPTGTVVSPIGAPSTAGSGITPPPRALINNVRTPISFELVRDGGGAVWYLGTTMGGQQVKLLIPSVATLEERTSVTVNVRSMATSALNKISRARLVKIVDRNEIFFLTGRWQKRWLPTWEVFMSYKDNKLKQVIELHEAIATLYDESKLVRLDGDARVWYLEGSIRREVPNDRAMRRYNLKWDDVSGMNRTEFNHYQEGPPLE